MHVNNITVLKRAGATTQRPDTDMYLMSFLYQMLENQVLALYTNMSRTRLQQWQRAISRRHISLSEH
jgi:hypothetical protein